MAPRTQHAVPWRLVPGLLGLGCVGFGTYILSRLGDPNLDSPPAYFIVYGLVMIAAGLGLIASAFGRLGRRRSGVTPGQN